MSTSSHPDHEYDVVVVGSGGGALTAAVTAATGGLRTLVLEKAELLGGTTAFSGGLLWVPDNPLMRKEGVADSAEDALRYLDALGAEDDPSPVSHERRVAYVRAAPEMVEFLSGLGMKFGRCEGYPDYDPDVPGAHLRGRPLEPLAFDATRLGPWQPLVRTQRLIPRKLKIRASEFRQVSLARTSVGNALVLARVVLRSGWAMLSRKALTICGEGLVCWLLRLSLDQGVDIWLSSPMTELWLEDGRVAGVVAEHGGKEVRIAARRGVVLAAGGYARSAEMRATHARQPSSIEWSLANDGDTGDGIRAAVASGAAVQFMEEAWYTAVSVMPDGKAVLHNADRSKPHSIIVDSTGARFANEAMDYDLLGHAIYARNETVSAIPAWLVIDNQHRKRYPFYVAPPGHTPSAWFESGYMKKGETVEELARACGIDPDGLARTVERFNAMAATGKDEDFHRGETVYQHHFGDPTSKPNASLGDLREPPFYAVEVFPGDVGTCGGVVTDGHARALRDDGTAIEGLYAAGNMTAPLAGTRNWGAGATIGQSMVFGYLAGRHLSKQA